jgi:hypothetical protein
MEWEMSYGISGVLGGEQSLLIILKDTTILYDS